MREKLASPKSQKGCNRFTIEEKHETEGYLIRLPKPKIWDVAVCGAGLGGAAAAEVLAGKGFTTLLLEKQSVPRYKACGGGVTQEFVEETKLPDDIIERSVEYLVLHHVGYETLEKEGKGACLWRADLDSFFTRQAMEAGATLKDGDPVVAARQERGFHLQTSQKEFRARILIAADGVTSTTLRCLGWNRFTPDEVAQTVTYEIELGEKTITQRFGDEHLHLYFGHDISPMGYGWVFPKRTTVSVGLGCRLTHIKNLKASFDNLLRFLKKKLTGGKIVRRVAHMLPAALRQRFGEGGLLAVGDAAGLVDPLSGKGIPYSVTSGQLAAEVAAQALETETIDQASTKYHSILEEKLLGGLQAKRRIQEDVYHTEENIDRFLKLWLTHRATTIASSLWHISQ